MAEYITAANLKLLAEAGTIRDVTAVPVDNHLFELHVRVGMTERTLRPAHRPEPRRFSLNGLAKFAREDLRQPRITVELADWQPKQAAV